MPSAIIDAAGVAGSIHPTAHGGSTHLVEWTDPQGVIAAMVADCGDHIPPWVVRELKEDPLAAPPVCEVDGWPNNLKAWWLEARLRYRRTIRKAQHVGNGYQPDDGRPRTLDAKALGAAVALDAARVAIEWKDKGRLGAMAPEPDYPGTRKFKKVKGFTVGVLEEHGLHGPLAAVCVLPSVSASAGRRLDALLLERQRVDRAAQYVGLGMSSIDGRPASPAAVALGTAVAVEAASVAACAR